MQPVNLTGELKRALKNADPQSLPDLDIKVQLLDLECFVSQKSLKLLFTILNENLNEGNTAANSNQANATKRRALSPIMEEDDRYSIGNRFSIQPLGPRLSPRHSLRPASQPHTLKEEPNDRLNMKLYVDLKRIKLIIVELISNKAANKYTSIPDNSDNKAAAPVATSSDSPLNEKRELKIRRINNDAYKIINFSHFEIQDIDFDYAKNDNLSWLAVFKMKELHLNDIRPDSNLAVKEMFIPLRKDNFFIVVNYKVDKSQNAFLDFTMSHLKINLCLPYILKLYQMVMNAIGPSPEQAQKPAPKPIDTADTVVVLTPPPQSPSSQSLTVVGKIELPEVILFAEPEKLNSKTLIMNTEILLRFESRSGVTELILDLSDLAIRLGENLSSRKVGVPFLSPCSAKISMRQVDATQPAQYKAFIQSLFLNMTPTMYEVVMGVINTINKTGTEAVCLTISTIVVFFSNFSICFLK